MPRPGSSHIIRTVGRAQSQSHGWSMSTTVMHVVLLFVAPTLLGYIFFWEPVSPMGNELFDGAMAKEAESTMDDYQMLDVKRYPWDIIKDQLPEWMENEQSEPVIVVNATSDLWPARKKWTRNAFLNEWNIEFPDVMVSHDSLVFRHFDTTKPIAQVLRNWGPHYIRRNMSSQAFFDNFFNTNPTEFMMFSASLDHEALAPLRKDVRPTGALRTHRERPTEKYVWMSMPGATVSLQTS